MDDRPDLYVILGVASSATPEQIQTAYRERAKVTHPDRFDRERNPSEWAAANQMLRDLNAAYNVLSNQRLRREYDASYYAASSGNARRTTGASTEQSRSTNSSGNRRSEPRPAVQALSWLRVTVLVLIRFWPLTLLGVMFIWIGIEDSATEKRADEFFLNGPAQPPVQDQSDLNDTDLPLLREWLGDDAEGMGDARLATYWFQDQYPDRNVPPPVELYEYVPEMEAWAAEKLTVIETDSVGSPAGDDQAKTKLPNVRRFYGDRVSEFTDSELVTRYVNKNYPDTPLPEDPRARYEAMMGYIEEMETKVGGSSGDGSASGEAVDLGGGGRASGTRLPNWRSYFGSAVAGMTDSEIVLRYIERNHPNVEVPFDPRTRYDTLVAYAEEMEARIRDTAVDLLEILVVPYLEENYPSVTLPADPEARFALLSRYYDQMLAELKSRPESGLAAGGSATEAEGELRGCEPGVRASVLPANGQVWRYNGRTPVAPLEVRASGGRQFLVKVQAGDRPVAAMFVSAGATVEMLLPIGFYTIKYAAGSGEYWCGHDARFPFGRQTSFSRADRSFSFLDEGTHYTGYTLELFMQEDGNLRTAPLSPEEW